MDDEALHAIAIVVGSLSLLMVAGFSTRPALSLVAAALFGAFAIYSMVALNVDGDYWGHLLPGFAVFRAAPIVLSAEQGGPLITSSLLQPALGAAPAC